MDRIEWSDVQGLVRRGMGWLKYSAYVLLEITDEDKARRWLKTLPLASGADVVNRDSLPIAVNIAFTFPGLCALGFDPASPVGFSREFCEGMAPAPEHDQPVSRRSSMLGDVEANDPNTWRWGGLKTGTAQVHMALLVFGTSDLRGNISGLITPETETGVRKIETLHGWLPDDKCEHFGFRDGLSQPLMSGDSDNVPPRFPRHLHEAATGEFLIGYRNERDNFPVSPHAPHDPDFGQNGTYLVLRELEQNVRYFEDWLAQTTLENPAPTGADPHEWLAAKIIGRWRNGAPLTRYPDQSENSRDFGQFDASDGAKANDFFYHAEDREGFRCPLGAHIRRAWPRDGLADDPERALLQAKLHRILRRGRLFGPAYDRENPDAPQNKKPRGLYFGCLNTDIAGQFEAVQHNWINNPKFSGLAQERDPLVGERDHDSCMTIQQSPMNLRLNGLKQFVVTRGGGYFFMPGIRAIKHLAAV